MAKTSTAITAQNQAIANAIIAGIPSITIAKETTMSKTHTLPTGTMSALETAMPKELISGTTYFDPIDLLEDKISHQANLHSRVLDSMMWMIDNTCINQARKILFTRYSEAESEHTDDITFKEFCQCVAEDISHPSLYEVEGNESTLAILLALRKQWHDATVRAFNADDRDYKGESLREKMASEEAKPASVGTRINFKKIAALESHGDVAKADRLYASYMEADAIATANQIERRKSLMPTVLEILRAANMYAIDSSRFDELPHSTQRQLTTFVVGAITRSRTELARLLARQPFEFGHMADAAFEATEALNKVINQKYSDAGELENVRSQSSIDHERGQKAASLKRDTCSID